MSVCVCLSVSVSVCLFVCVRVWLCMYFCVSIYAYVWAFLLNQLNKEIILTHSDKSKWCTHSARRRSTQSCRLWIKIKIKIKQLIFLNNKIKWAQITERKIQYHISAYTPTHKQIDTYTLHYQADHLMG